MSSPGMRPTLPTSTSEFALPTASSSTFAPVYNSSEMPVSPFMMSRARRPSMLKSTSDTHIRSPLVSSYSARESSLVRGRRRSTVVDEAESDREGRMALDSPTPTSGSSQDTTPPPLGPPLDVERRQQQRRSRQQIRSRSPSTPPRGDLADPRSAVRRLSYPIKPPRILTLLQQDSKPEETEFKSEALFQRLLASAISHPITHLATPASADRGRFPEEATTDDLDNADTASEPDDTPFTFGGTEPISISKPVTPAHSVNGDEPLMSTSMGSPGMPNMDIDMMGSPVLSHAVVHQWRFTPPPTAASAVRSNKRKLNDDRFDPYPSAKRRAVSPHYREHRTPGGSRGPVAIAIPSGFGSAMSSPTVSQPYAYPPLGRSSAMSSPTLRNAMVLASPILRPKTARQEEEEQREIDGAGTAVSGLTLC